MKTGYTEEAGSVVFDLLENDLAGIWEDIQSTPRDSTAEQWKQKINKIGREFSLTSRFALMRILRSRALGYRITDYAFYKCSFEGKDIVFPEGLEDAGHGILQGCKPESVYFPASLDDFTDGFLVGCGGEYLIDSDHEWLKSVNGIVFNKKGTTLYAFPCERSGSYSVPDGVTRIDEYAFYGSELKKISLPNGLKEIGKRAFKYCDKLTSINIPRSVNSIGEEAFYNTALETVTIMFNPEAKEKAFDGSTKVNWYGD